MVDARDLLQNADLRPTRQRLALAEILFDSENRHVTAEQLYDEARQAGIQVSVATIYNTLRQFTRAGLLRELVIEAERSYFDTNTSHHHHFYDPQTGQLTDIDDDMVQFDRLPKSPRGKKIDQIDVIVRLSSRTKKS